MTAADCWADRDALRAVVLRILEKHVDAELAGPREDHAVVTCLPEAADAILKLIEARHSLPPVPEIVRVVVERAEQACRYALKHQNFEADEDGTDRYRDGWEVAAEVCEKAIRPHVERHLETDLIEAARHSQPGAEGGVVGLRDRLGWPSGDFTVFDPDPTDDHGSIYLVCPGGLSLNFSFDLRPGLDAARVRWIADALNAAMMGDDPVGAAEREVGRAVYERIEHLIGGDSPELAYLAELVESVEEYGSYSGPALATPAPSDTQPGIRAADEHKASPQQPATSTDEKVGR